MNCDLCDLYEALYDCWFRVKCPLTGGPTGKIERHCVCKHCARQSIAYEKHGEEVFEITEENDYQI